MRELALAGNDLTGAARVRAIGVRLRALNSYYRLLEKAGRVPSEPRQWRTERDIERAARWFSTYSSATACPSRRGGRSATCSTGRGRALGRVERSGPLAMTRPVSNPRAPRLRLVCAHLPPMSSITCRSPTVAMIRWPTCCPRAPAATGVGGRRGKGVLPYQLFPSAWTGPWWLPVSIRPTSNSVWVATKIRPWRLALQDVNGGRTMTLALIINVAAVIALFSFLTATMRLPYRLPVARAAPASAPAPRPTRGSARVAVTQTRRGPHPS